MKIILHGTLINNDPAISARISTTNLLTIGKKGNIKLTVDTGFTGGIALPERILAKLNLQFSAVEEFTLADGRTIQLKMFKGYVNFNGLKIKTFFIEGEGLIGINFMKSLAMYFFIDFQKEKFFFLNNK